MKLVVRMAVGMPVHGNGGSHSVAMVMRTVHDGRNALLSQAVEEPLHSGFGSAPFGGIIFSQQVDYAHGCAFLETAGENS